MYKSWLSYHRFSCLSLITYTKFVGKIFRACFLSADILDCSATSIGGGVASVVKSFSSKRRSALEAEFGRNPAWQIKTTTLVKVEERPAWVGGKTATCEVLLLTELTKLVQRDYSYTYYNNRSLLIIHPPEQ